ncbi:MAG TPA: prepilin-type N-terminal cleavage/methylation domain-containing protein [Thermoleophilaceae bacterium]|jgi:type II secretory pathway pseudopilin PulG
MIRLPDERGITLVELLIATALMLVILTATLSSMDSFGHTTRVSADQNDSQQQARQAMGQLARELRNHAVANSQAPEGIALAQPYDLVFETVGANRPAGSANSSNVQRIRYCLDGPPPAKLWAQTQSWTTAAPPPVPSTFACPSSQWATQRVVAQQVVNRVNGATRPVFTYDAATAAEVRRVEVTLFVDTTPYRDPKETRLESAIFLRNANHAPAASFTATVSGGGVLVLNGTPSSDREGEYLRFAWRIDGSAIAPASETVDWPGLAPGSHDVELTVTDPGGLSGTLKQTVVVP